MVELKVVEQRYRAVIDVLDGMTVTEVAAVPVAMDEDLSTRRDCSK